MLMLVILLTLGCTVACLLGSFCAGLIWGCGERRCCRNRHGDESSHPGPAAQCCARWRVRRHSLL